MQGGYKRFIGAMQAVADVVLLNAAFYIAYVERMPFGPFEKRVDHYLYLWLFMNITWLVISQIIRLHDVPRFALLETAVRRTFTALVIHLGLTVVLIFSIKGYYYSRELMLVFYLLFTSTVIFFKGVFLYLLREYRKSGFNYKQVVIVGEGTIGNRLCNYFTSELAAGYRFVGFFHDTPEQCIPRNMVKGGVRDVARFIEEHPVDEIYCALSPHNSRSIHELHMLADNRMVRFRMVPDFSGFLNRKVGLDFYDDTPVLTFRDEPLEQYMNSVLKRVFDLVFSTVVLVLLLPVFLLISLAVKLSSPGPVFFKQYREGRHKLIFPCYKFRSMAVRTGCAQTERNDPRVTWIGHFLRRSSLDELPQFINVWLGHMSVVGPRPHMLWQTVEYAKTVDRLMVRYFVKPGITGWAQVHGYRGPLDAGRMSKRLRYDVWYIEHWSLWLDVKIIIRTVGNMIRGEQNAF